MPVDLYSGGAEHTTMHLLYSRFWHKALYDLKLVADKEPYVRRMNRGLILGPDGAKMSKSKGNVIDPDSIVKELGADTVRMYLAFIGPFNEPGSYPWNPDGVMGVRRFIDRVWKLQGNIITKPDVLGETVSPKDKRGRNSFSQETERLLHHTIKKVGEDLEALKFNTAISSMMIFINAAEKTGLTKHQYATFLQLLAPFAPHITEELWSVLKMKDSVHVSKWPTFKAKLLVADTLTFAVQINGKLRGQITAPATATEAEVRALAESDEKVRNHLSGEISKVIFVPGKLISFVVRS